MGQHRTQHPTIEYLLVSHRHPKQKSQSDRANAQTSAEDIDTATKYGFGFRFAILGLLEFIDWGGGDILFHAGNYMASATGEDRYSPPQIFKDNMANNHNGLRDKQGFLDYSQMDIPQYQRQKLQAFVTMLRHLDKMPEKGT